MYQFPCPLAHQGLLPGIPQVKGEPVELTEERALEFGRNLVDSIAEQVYLGKTEVTPCVYFLPGKAPRAIPV
jgi:hypothetical protein